ncbi:MAG: YciI family protein [Acidobacteriota bacterium]
MADFMLVLRDNPEQFADVSPEDMQRIVGRYVEWREKLAATGQMVGGEKLVDDEGRLLRRGDGALRVLDGPYSETKEIVGGYFILRAESMDEAVSLSESCPHLDFGPIEIRRIEAGPES